jgi:hypothetical protein
VSLEALSSEQKLAIAELQLCQAHVQVSSERTWQSGGILLAGAMASLVLMLQIGASETAAATISTCVGLGALVVLQIWKDLVRREEALRHASIQRMKELEREVGSQREARVGARDDTWPPMRLPIVHIELPFLETSHTEALETTGTIVQAGWVIVAAWRWLIVAGVLD